MRPTLLLTGVLMCGLTAVPAEEPVVEPEEELVIDPASGIHFDSDNPDALLIREVVPGSPAARARIQPGDTIVSIDDETFASAEEVETRLATLQGKPATVIVLRDGRERAVIYVNEVADVDTFQVPIPKYGQPAGIGVKIKGNDEVLVLAVWDGSPADRAGILPGDRLLAVNNVDLRGTDAFVAAIAAHQAGEPVEIMLRRGDVQQEVIVEPERWTLAFDEEPEFLEGWRERRTARRGCYDFDYGADYALLEREYEMQLERHEAEMELLRTELKLLRAELAETNARLADLQARATPVEVESTE
ncbi:MAG: PDZ domain-containing protein [Planctomycetota bacterium]|nr:MAG: PDZ domain-containing protein [Planctomycetota bacterium]REJ88483.1 MAG: PDZ domain-containing protein [Planctomycetota bacterium]REK22460.1 MAG: PDZ domain-containing protein [Planctomycetota bacterium]REK34890.1 MAG: PDZ domain-containing protein [Planctomycetota bacterium]